MARESAARRLDYLPEGKVIEGGFHGLHVIGALVWLFLVLLQVWHGRFTG
ncbi:MAG: hypothetical protein ACE5JU_17500 [Candidatus Binatia bacterium]